MLKLKIGNANKAALAQPGGPSAIPPQSAPPTPTSSSAPTPAGGFKLKLNVSQPPTPIEQSERSPFAPHESADKKKRPRKPAEKSKKRAAEDDGPIPAAKRMASGPSRKISIKLANQPLTPIGDGPGLNKISLAKRKASAPKIIDIRARGKVPPRPKGVGYDSEDSDTEKDPAIQQALVLRMEEGEDANYLREAISEGRIGPHPSQGDAEVTLRFIEKNYRRAIVTIRGRKYAAALVDLPCVVESMKSFDKKGWWKVADIAQMLLVLGRCNSDEEAKTMPLPREVNKDTYAYPHGLTPPMHWARRRRFRKRLNYNEAMNVEEEVKRLLDADQEHEKLGGTVTSSRGGLDPHQQHHQEPERPEDQYDFEFGEEDAEGEDAIETVEGGDGQQYEEYVEEDEDLEAKLQNMFDEDEGDAPPVITDSPAPIPDQPVASMIAVEDFADATPIATPIATPAAEATQDEQSEEEEESEDDEDSPDVVDEDAVAKQAERAQQLEEVADLEREVEKVRQKMTTITNQLLAQRERKKLAGLEEELAVKKQVFGLDHDDD
jgi:transcription initiation factor TFIID subunit 7